MSRDKLHPSRCWHSHGILKANERCLWARQVKASLGDATEESYCKEIRAWPHNRIHRLMSKRRVGRDCKDESEEWIPTLKSCWVCWISLNEWRRSELSLKEDRQHALCEGRRQVQLQLWVLKVCQLINNQRGYWPKWRYIHESRAERMSNEGIPKARWA